MSTEKEKTKTENREETSSEHGSDQHADQVSQSSSRRQKSESTPRPSGGNLSSESLRKCESCGKKGVTVHCVITGQLICGNCRGDRVRGVMKDLKKSKEFLEVDYPKSVRERIAIIHRVEKDLQEKKKKAEKDVSDGFRDLRKLIDEREKQVLKEVKAAHTFKENELRHELNIFEGHLKENRAALDRVGDNSCCAIHFAVGKVPDGEIATLCQTRKMYADIINNLHLTDERDEPIRSRLKVKFDKSGDDARNGVDHYGEVASDDNKEKKKQSKQKESEKSSNEEEKEDDTKEETKEQPKEQKVDEKEKSQAS